MSASGDKILYLLKTKGVQTSKALATMLDMTPMGARQHLLQLQKEKLVNPYSLAEKRGRPTQYWQLTSLALKRFPDRHEQLTLNLLNSIKMVFGQQGLDQLIAQREYQHSQSYNEQLNKHSELKQKVSALVSLRCDEGYMAEMQTVNDHEFLLIENHCPICAAATECQELCRSELQLFQRCFDKDADVKRAEHLLEGARRCVYRIKAKGSL
ncbi:helix-turn-helix transcriptional regulator [Neptunicella marina]|uniref:MarR family transcriptional regulator n=1 Tax=Neptunicella marina TaxID=2125989 RepID=A0A8J6LZZ5_9ALTE|nr:MarR family transcriptional regulator [Neptunicella marina]MBC3766625.1 MarR family transcriptional regulator [Neptunicella marina]